MLSGNALVEQSSKAPGCLDVSVSADPFEEGRVNIFEDWESKEALEAWRARAPRPSSDVAATRIEVLKHEIAHSGPPFD
jgi:quinol monooxygenase YgiN